MNKTKNFDGIFKARLRSIYNYETEIYEKQEQKSKSKDERLISVRCFKKKVAFNIVCKKVKYTFLKMYIQELNVTIKVDIREFLENKYNGYKINKKFLSNIVSKISKEIMVEFIHGSWKIVSYDTLIVK